MFNKTSTALLLMGLTVGSAAQAQNCPCNGGAGTPVDTVGALQQLLGGKMVCANLGNEQWQEWHNGATNGPVVDYKKGPGDPVDPSTTVGSYAISANGGAAATVAYTYGSTTYRYAVCQNGASVAFCGASFGGRDIVGAVVSAASGLQPCSGIAAASNSRSSRTQR